MNYINNLGDYVELLHALLSAAVGENAMVLYEHEPEAQDKPLPFIILPLPELIETSYAADGRQQDTLSATVFIKAPKSLDNPSVTAANIGGFVRAQLTNQYLDGALLGESALASEFDCVDEPVDIQGYPLKWHDNDQGYAITFEQTIRYGNLDAETFLLSGIIATEGDSEGKAVYEYSEESI